MSRHTSGKRIPALALAIAIGASGTIMSAPITYAQDGGTSQSPSQPSQTTTGLSVWNAERLETKTVTDNDLTAEIPIGGLVRINGISDLTNTTTAPLEVSSVSLNGDTIEVDNDAITYRSGTLNVDAYLIGEDHDLTVGDDLTIVLNDDNGNRISILSEVTPQTIQRGTPGEDMLIDLESFLPLNLFAGVDLSNVVLRLLSGDLLGTLSDLLNGILNQTSIDVLTVEPETGIVNIVRVEIQNGDNTEVVELRTIGVQVEDTTPTSVPTSTPTTSTTAPGTTDTTDPTSTTTTTTDTTAPETTEPTEPEVEPEPELLSDTFNPRYGNVELLQSGSTAVTPTFGDNAPSGESELPTYSVANGFTAPEGWSVNINADTGRVLITSPGQRVDASFTIPVLVTYPDDSTDTANISVLMETVTADHIDPSYPSTNVVRDQSKTVGVVDSHDDATYDISGPSWADIDADTGLVTLSPGNNVIAGVSTFEVTITYPDGSTDSAEFSVEVLSPMNETYPLDYRDITFTEAKSDTFNPLYDGDTPEDSTFTIDDGFTAPEGWSVSINGNTGVLSITSSDSQRVNNFDVPVSVTYSDGTTSDTSVAVSIDIPYANAHDPRYDDMTVTRDDTATIAVEDTPDGSTFEITNGPDWVTINEVNGIVQARPGAEAETGDVNVTVRVTYPDDTYEDTSFTVNMVPLVSELHDPQWQDSLTIKPQEHTVFSTTTDITLPSGTTISASGLPDSWLSSVNNSGRVTLSAPTDIEDGSVHTLTLTVTYSDGSTDIETVEITASNPSMADSYEVSFNDSDTLVPQRTTREYAPIFDTSQAPQVESWELSSDNDWLTINPATGVITATPGDDNGPGSTGEGTVTVNYPDGSVDEIPFSVTVGDPEKTDGTDLFYLDNQSVRIGHEHVLEPEFTNDRPTGDISYTLGSMHPDWVSIDTVTGSITLAPDTNVEQKAYDFNVVATYDDGTQDSTTVTVSVNDSFYNERIDFDYQDRSMTRGASPIDIHPVFTKSLPEGSSFVVDAPDWIGINAVTGMVTATPGATVNTGPHSYSVTVTYPDDSTDSFEGTIDVGDMSDGVPLSYNTGSVAQGLTAIFSPSIQTSGNYGYAPGTNFPGWASVDPATGDISISPLYTTTPGAKSLPIVVTYPDGSTGTTYVNFSVDRVNQAEWLEFNYAPIDVQLGGLENSDAPAFIGGIPQGNVRYTTDQDWTIVDSDGVVTIAPPITLDLGEHVVTITAEYSDGSTDTSEITVNVQQQDFAHLYTPVYDPINVQQNKSETVTIDWDGDTPDNAVFAPGQSFPSWATLDRTTGEISVRPSFGVLSGTVRIPVTVTYSDGTIDNASVNVTIMRGDDSDRYDFSYAPISLNQATTQVMEANVVDVIAGGVNAPRDGISFRLVGNNPDWVSIDNETGSLTVSPAVDTPQSEYSVTTEIVYADGTRENNVTGIEVTGTTDATRYDLVYPRSTIEQGDDGSGSSPKLTGGDDMPTGTIITANDIPSWVKISRDGSWTATPGYEVEPGQYSLVLNVRYSDGSTESTTLPLTVTNAELSKEFDSPAYSPARVIQGQSVSSSSPQDGNRALPEGTTYRLRYGAESWVSLDSSTGIVSARPGFNVDSGSYDVPVIVAYPDGSESVATWTVNVDQGRAADGFNPSYSSGIDAPQGSIVTIPAPRDNGQLLPEGTRFSSDVDNPEWISVGVDGTVSASPSMDVEAGQYQAITTVTYADGTIDNVPVSVEVIYTERSTPGPTTSRAPAFNDQSEKYIPSWERTDGGTSGGDDSDDTSGGNTTSGGSTSDGETTSGGSTSDESTSDDDDSSGGSGQTVSGESNNPDAGPMVNTGGGVANGGFIAWVKSIFK